MPWDSRATLASYGELHLRALAAAMGHADVEGAVRVYREMTRHWGETPLAAKAFRSRLTFDSTPLEFSLAVQRSGPRLRWGVDCTSASGDRAESRAIGLDLCRRLGAFGAELSRFGAVFDLLTWSPARPRASGVGVGVDFSPKGAAFKAYFAGAGTGEGACGEALEALGLRAQARFMRELFAAEGARFYLFSLDLVPGDAARVKVYLEGPPESFAGTMRRLVEANGEGPEKLALVEAFVRTLSGIAPGADVSAAAAHLITTVQFVSGHDAPLGLACNYAPQPLAGWGDEVEVTDDGRAAARVREAFAQQGLPAGPYERALAAFARVPLEDEYMIHNCVTLQGKPGETSLAVYLNPRFNAYLLEPDEW